MKHTALITGASSGIGKELAFIHAEHGGDMVIVARSNDKLLALKQDIENQHGTSVYVITKDLTKENAPLEVYEEIKAQGIEIDYLINNAGFGGHGLFHERSWEIDQSMIQLNILALTQFCKLYLPDFIARGSGKILNVSSTASFTPGPLQAVYFATKSYVQFLSNAISEEIRDTSVTLTNLMPGATETDFEKTANLENTNLFKQTASARKVAEDGYKGLLAGKLDVISGLTTNQKLLLAVSNFMPKQLRLSVIKKMHDKS